MLHRYLIFLLLMVCWPAHAQVYKCVAANGDLTFSQTPCSDEDSKVSKQQAVNTGSNGEADCKLARGFALWTAREMKRGVTSDALFDQYGGLNSLSRGSVSLISYVYQYRANDDVSTERVADLSFARCKAKSFGDVGCEQLPRRYTNQLGGCGMTEGIMDAMTEEMLQRSGATESPPPTYTATTTRTRNRVSPEARAHAHAERRQARERQELRTSDCKQRIDERIDAINAELRSGYSASRGIALKDRRRDLEQERHEC